MKKYGYVWMLLLSLASVSASAENLRIGFVNTEQIFREAKEAVQITKRLEKEFAVRRDQLKKLGERRAGLIKTLEKSSIPDDIKRLEREFSGVDRDYQVQYTEVREDYAQRRDEEFSMLRDKANQAIIKVAKKEGFDLILQEAVYADPRLDITAQILKAMND